MNNYLKSVIVFFGYWFGVQIIPAILLGIFMVLKPDFMYIAFSQIQLITMAGFFVLYYSDFKDSFKRLKFKNFYKLIVMQFVIYFVSFITLIVLALLGITSETSENQESIELMIQAVPLWFTGFQLVIVAPICEEVTFRHAIISPVKNKIVYCFAIMASCMIFALLHVSTELASGNITTALATAVPYIAISSVLTFNYVKTKHNIVANILLHGLNNLIAMLLII